MIEVVTTASGAVFANSATTDSFDSTGGEAIIAGAATFGDFDRTIADSESNSYSQLNRFFGSGGSVQISLAESIATGAAHDVTCSGTYSGPCVFAIVTKGLAESPYDQASAGASGAGTTIQPGSITAPEDGCLFVTAIVVNDGATLDSISIDSGFTVIRESFNSADRGAIAYKIQGTAGAENPTWTAGSGNAKTSGMWLFLPAAGGAVVRLPNLSGNFQKLDGNFQ